MGSFYSNCSITNMTLTHQKVARLLLVPSHFRIDISLEMKEYYDSRNLLKAKGLITSNEGSLAMFSPFGFPIFGEYDDYGNLCNINRDRNVEILEKYFEASVEEILECASNEDTENNLKLADRLTFTDIRREVYEFLGNLNEVGFYKRWREESLVEYFESFDETEIDEYSLLIGKAAGFIPNLCKNNFLIELNIDRSWEKEYRQMYNFICNLSQLRKLLLPSTYGGQDPNFKLLGKVNRLANRLMKEDLKWFDE